MASERGRLVLLGDLARFEGGDLVDLPVLVVVVLAATQLTCAVEVAVRVDHAIEVQVHRATHLAATLANDRDVGLAVSVGVDFLRA